MAVPTSIAFVTGNAGKLREVTAQLGPSSSGVAIHSVKLDLDELQDESAAIISDKKAREAFRIVNGLDAAQCDGAPFRVAQADRGRFLSATATLVDDTSLSFSALDDLPGPYIKFFLERLGAAGLVAMTEGFTATAAAEQGPPQPFVPPAHRRATATAIYTLCHCIRADSNGDDDEAAADGLLVVRTTQFIGDCPGTLVSPPRGSSGFGWDPVFAPCVNLANHVANREALAAYVVDPASGRYPAPSSQLGFTLDANSYAKTFAEMDDAEKSVTSHRFFALAKLKVFLAGPV